MKEPASDTRPNWSHVTSQNTYQQQFAKQERSAQKQRRRSVFPCRVLKLKIKYREIPTSMEKFKTEKEQEVD